MSNTNHTPPTLIIDDAAAESIAETLPLALFVPADESQPVDWMRLMSTSTDWLALTVGADHGTAWSSTAIDGVLVVAAALCEGPINARASHLFWHTGDTVAGDVLIVGSSDGIRVDGLTGAHLAELGGVL